MLSRSLFANLLAILLVAGCAVPSQPNAQPHRLTPLAPQLGPEVSVAVVAKDRRPQVEKEKKPSTEFLYSGALFAVEGNEQTVATDLSNLVVQQGGARRASPSLEIPNQGPALLFELAHWYSRAPLKPDKSLIVVTGDFSGTLTLYRDGKALASVPVSAKGIPGVVDTTAFAWEKKDNAKLVWNAMLNCANSAQQNGYAALYKELQERWRLLGR